MPGTVNAGSTANSGYQLLAAGAETFSTDANGSLTVAKNAGGSVLRGWNYDSQNRATEVYKGATPTSATIRTRWDYDAGGARFRRTDDGSGGPGSSTLYLDNVERVTTGVNVTWRRMLAGVAVMALVGTNPALPTTNVLLHDHIGSVVAVANSSGALVERGDYAAFGGMRTSIDGVAVGLAALSTTTRGFTGHEQLGSLNLIHMNGRIYDPGLGRFLQADPMIQDPGNPQNWNPYSYVFNNPLVNTDPTGMFSIGQLFKTIAAIVISVYLPGIGTALFGWSALTGTIVAGFLGGVITSGSLKGGLTGAFSAGLFFGIGGAFKGLTGPGVFAEKVLAHGIAGGVMSSLQGGKFGSGFIAAGFTQALSPVVGGIGDGAMSAAPERIAVAALIGGTASELSGGKFTDGAVTGAFSQAFNEEAHRQAAKETRTAYVGGAMDAKGGPVLDAYKKFGGPNDKYFEWTQDDELTKWIQDNNKNYSLAVISHSYGADMAATVVANGNYVDRLITVDPVGWSKPNLMNVNKYSGDWTNYYAKGAGIDWNNTVATVGGAWNKAPQGFADHFYTVKLDHVAICQQYCKP